MLDSIQTRDRLVESEILLELAIGAGSSLDMDTMLRHALPLYARKLGCAMAGVLDAAADYLTLACSVPRDLSRNPDWREAVQEIAQRFRRGMVPVVTRIRVGNYYFHAFLLDDFGVLVLARTTPLSDVLLKELDPVIRLFARSCGACRDYERSRAMEKMRGMMVQLSEASATAGDLRSFCEQAHDILKRQLPADSMYVAIRNRTSGLIEFPYFVDEKDPHPQPRPPEKGLTDYVLDLGQSFQMQSAGAKDQLNVSGYGPLGSQANDWIGIPLKQAGQTYGVLAIQNYTPGARYSEMDVQLMEQLGGLISEIIFRLDSAAALRERDQNFRLLFNSLLSGFALHEVICDADGKPVDYRYLEVNPSFEALTGLSAEQLIGRTVLEVIPQTEPYWIETYGQVAITGKPVRIEHYAQAFDKHFEVHAYSPRSGQFAVIFNDVTERVRNQEERVKLERQMQHTQKLESLGLLAGGIAHDFNNLLMAILGNLELAQSGQPADSECRTHISEAIHAALRATDLTRQMLAYSGKGIFQIQAVDLNALVEENAHMLRAAIPSLVEFDLQLAGQLPAIQADPGQLQQVIMNLITNGAESISGGRGVVRLRTGHGKLSDELLSESVLKEKPPGGMYVWLEVKDTGCGMDEETQSRLFDPFFTTKFSGRGLGLSALHGIVRAHQGAVFLNSKPGAGTIFRVAFPAADTVPMANVPKPSKIDSHAEAVEAAGTLLIAEDDVSVLRLCVSVAEGCGFRVIPVLNGEDAVQAFQTHQNEITGVVLDLTMPALDGISTLRELRRLNPGLKIVLMSGHSEQEAMKNVTTDDQTRFMQKPFRLREMRSLLLSVFQPGDSH